MKEREILSTGWGVLVKTPTSTWSGRGAAPAELIPYGWNTWLVPVGCSISYTYTGRDGSPQWCNFAVPEKTPVMVSLRGGRTGSGNFRYRLKLHVPEDAPVHLPGLRSSDKVCPCPGCVAGRAHVAAAFLTAAAIEIPAFVVLRRHGSRDIRGVAAYRGDDGNLRIIPVLPPDIGDSNVVRPGDAVEPATATTEELSAAATLVADSYYLDKLGTKAIAGVKAWLESQAVGANQP